MSLATPNYLTTASINILDGSGGTQTLPVGSFVRPIDPYYLPKHIKEKASGTGFTWGVNLGTHSWYFTHYGIVILPINIVRKL